MKRTVPSPKRRGLIKHDPCQLDPQLSRLCPEAINVSEASARSMIEKINSEHADRHLAFRSVGDQLELLRLEALRLKMLESTKPKSDLASEMYSQDTAQVSIAGLSPTGEPGPTVPHSTRTSMRARASVLSESEISVLDLGPSMQFTHLSTRNSRCNSSSASPHTGVGLTRTTAPSFVPGPGSDTSEQQVERHLRTDELESIALTSASGSIDNEFPLNLRQRRQNQPNITLPSPQELRPHRVNRSFTISDVHGSRDESGYDPSPNSFADEPTRRIFSLSVPQSPQSPALPPHPTLRRSQSSFNGMEPAFSAMRNAERARKSNNDAAGAWDADLE
ncbi:hypothetical protein Pdw03_3617 [Penicillium digitatum]|uniref:Uncharacterized protein n=3 Tax=Penicillium digitatum TaxID=36651 RepID=K9FGL8_PEND2|nr:hypothetical protein PDIP_78380 [Penicillium digitatum Pd1]EKV06577.1 hypothetical protein PDIP_78380 [Penicillium digitatum Pd1]EKV08334.1 hypothetical protein PDIG_69090 [Penicillium digitatum PHI26]KAG0160962.1 hypothetical protein PDIDSM_8494 [Penicillium digitatum]QQK40763.1 hypothetical protein Pdw03_3617 [Penicillium digitatum]